MSSESFVDNTIIARTHFEKKKNLSTNHARLLFLLPQWQRCKACNASSSALDMHTVHLQVSPAASGPSILPRITFF
jgi:hypothetical protein